MQKSVKIQCWKKNFYSTFQRKSIKNLFHYNCKKNEFFYEFLKTGFYNWENKCIYFLYRAEYSFMPFWSNIRTFEISKGKFMGNIEM